MSLTTPTISTLSGRTASFLPTRALAGKILPRERVVDDDDRTARRSDPRREFAAVDHLRADRPEVAVADVNRRSRSAGPVPAGTGPPGNREAVALAVAAKRRILHRGRGDRRRAACALSRSLPGSRAPTPARAARGRASATAGAGGARADPVSMVNCTAIRWSGLKPASTSHQRQKAPSHQPGTDDEQHRDGDFGDDQRTAQPAGAAAGDAASAWRSTSCASPRDIRHAGTMPDQQTSRDRHAEREGDNRESSEISPARGSCPALSVSKPRSAERTRAPTRRRRRCPQAAGFPSAVDGRDARVVRQVPAARPLRGAAGGTRQLQAGDVDARHQQHEADGTQQYEQAVLDRAADHLARAARRSPRPTPGSRPGTGRRADR